MEIGRCWETRSEVGRVRTAGPEAMALAGVRAGWQKGGDYLFFYLHFSPSVACPAAFFLARRLLAPLP